jgi:16S rRNA A1518/A1519 N6-dimethyltransferase RsmA/KsgA/DIM1 with predicted DNA glycosylase/AP lyase activity
MKYTQNKELMKRIEKLLNENFEKVNKMMRKANKESLENLINEDLNLAQISETQKKSRLPDDG